MVSRRLAFHLLIATSVLTLAGTATASGTFVFRKTITINQPGGRADQLNFPLLVSITGDTDLGNVQNPNGYDLVFSDGTSRLDFEIEYFDRPTGTLLAWVRIPNLRAGVNTIYLYYGDPNTTLPTETPEAVWDSDHVGVWHMGEVGNGSPNEYWDSSLYGNHGQGGEGDPLFVPSRVTGPLGFGYAQRFSNADGKWDLIDCGDDASFDITGNQLTLEAWIRHNITAAFTLPNHGILNHRGFDTGYRLVFMNQASVPPSVDFDLPSSTHTLRTANGISSGTWHHIVATYNGATMKVYVDGVNNVTDQLTKTTNILPSVANQDFWIGHGDQPKDVAWSYPWDGEIDEVRVSKVARSADWIATEYDNQTSTCFPSTTFCSLGSQTAGPFSAGTLSINYRSIGTFTGNLASAGSVTTVAGSPIVSFDTPLPASVGPGDLLKVEPGGLQEDRYILTRDSDMQVTVHTALSFSNTTYYNIQRAYNTLADWEKDISVGGRGGPLVSENRREIGFAYYDGSDFTTGVTFDGSTTDASHYMMLTVPSGHRHNGLASGGVVLDNGGSTTSAIIIRDEFVTVEWLEIKGGIGTSAHGIELNAGIASPNYSALRYNVIHDVGGDGISVNNSNSVADVFNNIVYNASGYGIHFTTDLNTDTRVNLFNNTVYACTSGGIHSDVRQTSVRVDPRNNISHSNPAGDFDIAPPFDYAYYCSGSCTQIANQGLIPDSAEYLADPNNNFTLSFTSGSDALYLGSFNKFRGVGVVLTAAGSTGVDLQWSYWNGSGWVSLESGSFVDGTANLSLSSSVYWSNDPSGWATTSVNGSPNLYFVRVQRASGSFSIAPREGIITRADVNMASRNNLSSDYTASPHSRFENGASGLDNVNLVGVNFMSTTVGGENLHIGSGSLAEDRANDLSHILTSDIDSGLRIAPWDIGADEISTATAVELVDFETHPGDGAVELTWETGSEIDNVGFYLYRALAADGPFELVNDTVIPGLGSSPLGAHYRYVDSGLVNDTTYFYELEDLESTGVKTRHGPVSATPHLGASFEPPEGDDDEESSFDTRITYGDPEATSIQILPDGKRDVLIELTTEGFYAIPQEDGSVRLEVPGFLNPDEPGIPDVPIKQAWVQALVGKNVRLVSVKASDVQAFSLRPAAAELLEPVMTPRGEVRLARRASNPLRAFRSQGLYPEDAARLASVAFQQELKKALVELAPLRWDTQTGKLLLARRLLVRVRFEGKASGELSLGGARGKKLRPSKEAGHVVAQLVTHREGLYAVSFDDLFGKGRAIKTRELRLSYQGETVPYFVLPNPNRFAKGSLLFFLSRGEDLNPYGREAVFELAINAKGDSMPLLRNDLSGLELTSYRNTRTFEENHLFQGRLTTAPDIWLWDQLLAPTTHAYPFELSDLASGNASLSVWIQGTTDLAVDPDHHLRVFLNGTLLDDFFLEGELDWQGDYALLPGILLEGENTLEIENVGDTGAAYSQVMFSRFQLSYPRQTVVQDGSLEGVFSSGVAAISGLTGDAFVLDTTDSPQWLKNIEMGEGTVRFQAEENHRYLVADSSGLLAPEIRDPLPLQLSTMRSGAEYLVIAPQDFLEAAWPLLELRASQGLSSFGVSTEQIFSEFGHGETRPQAIRDFLEHAYQNWDIPPRYVLLLGDATFDFKDYLEWGVQNQVPPFPLKTPYIWTASDPAYALVNGDDVLPDLALGRLPAANLDEARALVDKVLAYENGGFTLDGTAVLIADQSDSGGDFQGHAQELAQTLLHGHDVTPIYLAELGTGATHNAILQAFDDGASLMSFIGHGGMQLWNHNILKVDDVGSLAPQPQQPILFTMNCLNGYFQFPLYDSLAESLLKAPDKGVIAAFSPSGLSLDGPAHLYHRLLLAEVLSGQHATLGDAILAAQAKYVDAGGYLELLKIYTLFGDPALRLFD